MAKESQVVVQRVRILNTEYQQLELAIADNLADMKPGQAFLARPKALRIQHVWNPYPRDVWYPISITKRKLIVDVPTTAVYQPGDVLDVIGPVGKALRFRSSLRHVLLMAVNTTPAPLLMATPWLVANKVSVSLVLIGTAQRYPTGHLASEIEVIRGEPTPDDPLAWPNQVTTIGWADQVFVTAGGADEREVFGQVFALFNLRRADIADNYLFGVFQSLSPCGVGACDGCAVRTVDGPKLACTDGPAFDLKTLVF